MRIASVAHFVGYLALGIVAWTPAIAQKNVEASAVPSRVVERVDDSKLVTLTGNTHFMARSQFDKGLVDPQFSLERMILVLKRSPEQESALEKFMAEQLDPKSANFHNWLEPEEFGKLYGPSDGDIAAVTSWLQNHGFQIYQVNKGRVTIEFSGTADQIQQAFHTEIHHYLVNGKAHIANNRDPQIPEALAPVITGITSLHDFFPVHQSILGKYVRRDPKTGKVTPVDPVTSGPKPQYGFTDEEGDPAEDITPYDFATIYNLLPLWNAGITGKGQTIAISAVTDIEASDVNTFRTTFGLGSFTGTINQIHNGTDPGVVTGAQVENTLDTEWSGATAPDATVDVVITATTATTFGGILSDQYIVEHASMFTIMSASYGGCEIALGTAGNSTMNGIYQQGSAEGISMFESSGDQGSTGCDNSDATTFPAPATYGLQVNGDASSPYITAVGGTEFTWQNYRTTYWSATNSTTNLSNALGYIPESPWNGTCTSQVLLDRFWQPNYGYTTFEQVCNEAVSFADEFVKVTGGSGGVSSCITSTGDEFSTCGGGYAQPSWQKGVTGMPGTKYRYLPDVSLFASSGFPYGLNGSAYLICVASNATPKTCDYTDNSEIIYQEVGGTSVSSPALAGIMALVQQKQNGKAQGLANPVFYALAAKDNLTNCNSSTVKAGNACNFYDVTYGNNAQVCTTGSINCVTNTSGDAYGVVSGYSTTTGYDQATGLGSVNAANLVNNWPSVVSSPTITISPTALTFASTAEGSTTAAQVVTVKNTGTATVTLTSETITGTDSSSFLKSATTCGTTLAAAASCTVSVEFKPAAAGTLTGSLSIADNATGSPQTVALTGTGTAAPTYTVSLSPTSLAFASTAEGSITAAQVVTVKNTGTAAVTLTSETITGTYATSFLKSATTCGTTLAAAATCTVSVEFKPLAVGALTASLSIADNATGTPQTVALTGTGTAALTHTVSLSPTSVAFASTAEGSTTAAQVVTVKNTGTAAVTLTSETITGTYATSFLKSATTCGTTLAAAATCTVSVEFKPLAVGALTASLSVADNATGTPQTVALTGTGTAALTHTVSLSPTSVAFASTAEGSTTAAQVVTVKNTGTGAVTLTSETITGTYATSFLKSATTCGTTLAAAASCTVSVEFKPLAVGALTASLSVADNATGTPQTVALTGTGTAALTHTVSLSPTSVAFASTAEGSTTAAQVVTVKNTGTGAVTLTSETITGTYATSFLKSATTCGTTLAAAASCTVSVEFKPLAVGALTASLSVADNATGTPQTVALTGTGVAAATPTVTLTPASIAFPNTIVGTTSDAQIVTLKNTGTVAVTITSIAMGGTNATSFPELGTCGASLAAGASCSLYIAFDPASAAALTGTLSVTDNATGSPQKVTLTGTGTAIPSVKLSTTSIAFPTTTHGKVSAAQAITLTNSGTATLNLTSIALTGTNPTDFEALNTCTPTLAAGASCTVYVAFRPATAAAFKAALSIVDNGSASPQSVALSGTGD